MENNSELIIYTTEEGETKVDVTFVDDIVWLTQEQMSELFQKTKSTIVETEDKKWIDVLPHDGHAEILFLL